MERAIPRERRKEWFDEDREKGIGTDDDPRWTAVLAAQRAASDAETQAAWALAHIRPASLAGAAALLSHAAEFVAGGDEWPCEDPKNENGDEWDIVFHRNLAAALEATG